jgi:hypothetical protein
MSCPAEKAAEPRSDRRRETDGEMSNDSRTVALRHMSTARVAHHRRRGPELHDQFRPAAPGRARRAASGDGTGRRNRRAHRSACRPAASRHRKADRAQDLLQALPYFDRLDYCSPLAWSIAMCWPSRSCSTSKCRCAAVSARAVRRADRICNHMLNLGSHVMDVGAMTPNLWLFECARIASTSSSAHRARGCTAAWFRPGGVHQDVPLKLLTDIADWLDDGRLPACSTTR